MDFKVGDEVWWFKVNTPNPSSYGYHLNLSPGEIELVHDQIKEIKEDDENVLLVCWHCHKRSNDVWGKTRQEAWNKLKENMEQWGALD